MITVPPSQVIATWISQNTDRVIGGDLFVSLLPDQPDNVMAVFDTVGIIEPRCMLTGHDVRHYGVSIQVRTLDYPGAYAELSSLVNALNALVGETVTVGVTNVTLSAVKTTSGPFFIGSSNVKNTSMFSLNMLASIGEN